MTFTGAQVHGSLGRLVEACGYCVKTLNESVFADLDTGPVSETSIESECAELRSPEVTARVRTITVLQHTPFSAESAHDPNRVGTQHSKRPYQDQHMPS